MQQDMKPRLVRAHDFVGEALEAEADKMAPSEKSQTDIWRDVAKDLRASKSSEMVRVWEEPEAKPSSAATG
jgi:hypothetical protein